MVANAIPTHHEKGKNSHLIYSSEKCHPRLAVRRSLLIIVSTK